MNTTITWDLSKTFAENRGAKSFFRERFQRALSACVARGFSMEESFGMIWVETWEEISLSDEEQAELFDELLGWAKLNLSGQGHRSCHENARGRASF